MTLHSEMSRCPAVEGAITQPGSSRSAVTKYTSGAENNSQFLPPRLSPLPSANLAGSRSRHFIQAELEPVQPLNARPYLLQLALDILALAFCIVFLCVTAASVPLALFLMIFASF